MQAPVLVIFGPTQTAKYLANEGFFAICMCSIAVESTTGRPVIIFDALLLQLTLGELCAHVV